MMYQPSIDSRHVPTAHCPRCLSLFMDDEPLAQTALEAPGAKFDRLRMVARWIEHRDGFDAFQPFRPTTVRRTFAAWFDLPDEVRRYHSHPGPRAHI